MSAEQGRGTLRLRPRAVPVRIEHDAGLPDGERLALLASWGEDRRVSRSVVELIRALRRRGYPVVMIRASEDSADLAWPTSEARPDMIIRKPNIGYDFGSWAVGMEKVDAELDRRHVLLVNDSLAGPFGPIDDLLDHFELGETDAWAATRTTQFIPHLQSFFLGFSGGVLATPQLRRFWRRLPLEDDKLAIVDRYELGLTRLLFSEAFTSSAAIEPERVVREGDNPMIHGWRRVLDAGFPFVKREILVRPEVATEGNLVAETIKQRYGEDPHAWI